MLDDTAAAAAVDAAPSPAATETASPAPAGPEPSAEEKLDARLLEIFNKNNPERADDGKFAARQQAPAQNADQPKAPAAETAPTPSIDAPASWSDEKKALWPSLPPDARAYIAQRESESHQAITRMGGELAQFRPLGELLSQNQETFARHGVDVQTGVAALLDAQRRLDEDPRTAIAAIAEMYGVNLADLVGAPAAQQQQGLGDPVVATLRQEVADLKRSLQERERRDQEAAGRQEAALQEQTKQDIAKWSADKPHFAEVRQDMAVFIANGRARTLDEAYDMAIHAVPAVRSKVMAEADTKRLQEAQKQASAAKRDASMNVGARRAAAAPTGKWDDDANLQNLFERASRAG